MNSFSREPKQLRSEIINKFTEVVESGHWILGPNVEEFESNWASCVGLNHCAGVANGLDALQIGMKAIGLKPGDEIITTPLTAFASTLSIINIGAKPIFCDVDECGLLDLKNIKNKISNKTRAILFVHLYGQSQDLKLIQEFCEDEKIFLIEDCAQAHLSENKSGKSGSFGIFSAWSFYPTKNLGAIGDAGAITSNNMKLINDCKKIRNYGQTDRYNHELSGVNSRLHEVQAAILNTKLNYLDEWISKRNLIASHYNSEIKNSEIKPLNRVSCIRDSFHLFVILSKKRDTLQKYLNDNEIQSIIHYPILSHHQRFKYEYETRDTLSNALSISSQCLSIPCHPFLSNEEIDKILCKLNEF